jgi:hypothetical protein
LAATLSLLAFLSFKALGDGQVQSQAAICMSNLRRLGQGWLMYAEDNAGRLVPNLDGGPTMTLSYSNQTWVLGWLDFQGGTGFPMAYGGRSDTNTFLLSQLSPLAPYLKRDPSVFRCPADPSLSLGIRGDPRVRSISMNAYHGGRVWDNGHQLFTRLSDFVSLPPSESFTLIEENEASINDGFFVVSMTGYPNSPQAMQWVDFPASFHDRGLALNFADGHGELKRWKDPRTTPRFSLNFPGGRANPNNPDIRWLQDRTTRRQVIQ